MKKLICIGLISLGILILIIGIVVIIPKRIKANIIFGTNKCIATEHVLTTDITEKECLICFGEFNCSSSNAPICNNCAHELGRCSQSGKIKNNEYHYNEK